MAQYTIICRQALELMVEIEAQSANEAKATASDECRTYGDIINEELEVICVEDISDEDRLLNDRSLFASQPQ